MQSSNSFNNHENEKNEVFGKFPEPVAGIRDTARNEKLKNNPFIMFRNHSKPESGFFILIPGR